MAVYRRGKRGIYVMDFTLHGVRVKESTGKTHKTLALQVETQKRAEIEERLANGGAPAPAKLTLSAAIDRCHEERWKDTRAGEMTYARAKLLVNYLGDVELSAINGTGIEQLRSRLRQEGKAPATVNRYCAALRTVLNMAHRRWNAVDRLPYVPMYRESAGRIRILTDTEERNVLQFVETHPLPHWRALRFFFEFLFDTGMRVGEALGLTGKDIDLTRKLIVIPAEVSKSGKPRSVPMTGRVRLGLYHYVRQPGAVFPYPQDLVNRVWDYARAEMNLTDDPEFVPHALRHTCASRMVQRGVDLYTVKEVLGHSTIKVTERYAHLSPEKLRAAVDVLEKPVAPVADDMDLDGKWGA